MSKKLLFICARLPYPASNGRKSVMYHYCKILHEIYGYDVYVVSFLEHGDCVDGKPDFIRDVFVLDPIKFFRKIYNLIKYTVLQGSFPMQVSLFYCPDYKSKIADIIQAVKPNVVMTDMVRTCEYAKEFNGYKIADLDDMLSLRYERQLNVDLSSVNIYGNYVYSLPAVARRFLNIKMVKKAILNHEITLLKKYEREIASVYDKTVFVAKHEAEMLNQEMNFDKACAVPLGVDVDYYGELFGKIAPEKHTVAFLGVMNAAHNEAGALFFIKEVLPIIRKRIPDAKFVVVGGGVTDSLKEIADDSVKFTGRVEDVRTVVGACEVFVCPLVFGSGIKTKNLEAMAMGIPVVTTTIGAENINAKNGQEWLVADSAVEFADMVITIMDDSNLRNKLIKNANEFVQSNFTWKVAEERMKICLPGNVVTINKSQYDK